MVEHAVPEVETRADGFTVQDWLAWDGPGDFRVELIDGALVVNPAAVPRHNRIVQRLCRILDDALAPAGLTTEVTASGVVAEGMHPDQAPIPDVLLVSSALDVDDVTVIESTDVALAVEVLSPSSRRTDRVRKLELYAEMGIPHYWVVDPTAPVTITTHVLDGKAYQPGPSASGDEVLVVTDPFEVTVTPSALAATRGA